MTDEIAEEVTDVTAAPETTEEGQPVEPEKVEASAEETHRDTGAEKRIKTLTRNWREEQRRNDALEQRLNKVESQFSEQNAPKRPVSDDFETSEQYEDALIDWKLDSRKQPAQPQAPRVPVGFAEQIEQGKETYEDFEKVVFDQNLMITQSMTEMIADSDRGADLAYHLGKNPDKAAHIAALSPMQQARELGRIESSLSEKPTHSQAPTPATPLNGQSEATADPDKMTADEWRKHREAELQKRYG